MSLDQEQAIKAAIRQFAITDPEHQKRLAAYPAHGQAHREPRF
jgi:hypothetical protein